MRQINQKDSPFKFQLIGIILIITTFLFSSVSLFYSFNNTRKIGFVDAVKLMSMYKGMEVVKKSLEERSKVWQANIDTLQFELDNSIAEYNRTKATSSIRENKLMEELVGSKQQQLAAYQQSTSEQFQKQDQEMSMKLMDKVNAYIKKYGEEHDYSLILAATPYGNIAFGEVGIDLTVEIANGLNKEFK